MDKKTSRAIAAGRGWKRAAGALLACLCLVSAAAAGDRPAIGPAPAWVLPQQAPESAPTPTEQVRQGLHYLLTDVQTRIDSGGRTMYRHVAVKALDAKGVEEAANVEIEFDPSYQALVVHAINVRRAGRVIAKLPGAPIRVLQREKELDYLIFDGTRSAHVFLDDVRAGDIVEYSYSLRGSNPVFRGRHFGQFWLRWSVPVQRMHIRLLAPLDREIHLTHRNTEQRPERSVRNGIVEYRWVADVVEPLRVEDDAPGWYDPYPGVRWSEFKDWAAVAQWALPLYPVGRLGPAAQAEVEQIARQHPGSFERAVAALQFVQREIRYLGVEVGSGSHAPSPPDLVLKRRFGDCKDKSLLTVSLLKALGIDAQVALVNTRIRRGVGELHPGPDVFNHAIVRLQLGGRSYWFDPTRSPQKGDLDHLFQPDYGLALVIAAQTQALESMGTTPVRVNRRHIHSVIDSSEGIGKPARLTVTTVLDGAAADAQRGVLAGDTLAEIQKRFLNFYARYYPGLTAATPMKVSDDATANRLTVVESYALPAFWEREEAKKRHIGHIHAPEVEDLLHSPQQTMRTAPLALSHPLDVTHVTELRLPEAWSFETERTEVKDPAFEFVREQEARGDRSLIITDRLRSVSDHVSAAQTPGYAASVERARGALGYTVYKEDAKPAKRGVYGELGALGYAAFLLAMMASAGFAVYVYRR